MNTFWTIPTAIEVTIFALCLAIARLGLRLRTSSAVFALVLVCPVPLCYLVAGGNSALFPSDALGVFCLFWLASPRRRPRAIFADHTAHLPVALASVLLVALPGISTALGYITTSQGDWKLIVLGLCRGCSYLGLFSAAIAFGSRVENLNKMIALQCIAFSLICGCGILQYSTGLDLTLPSPTSNLLEGDLAVGSGAGFMGLYRGAIGGWGAAILGGIPLVLLRRKYGWLIAPACMLSVLIAIVLTGSRQGLIIGLIAATLGTLGAVSKGPRGISRAGRLLLAVATLVIGGLCLSAISVNTTYERWINSRFGSLFESTSVLGQVASRDTRMWYAIDRWFTSPVALQLLGVGRGRLNDGLAANQYEVGYVDSELVWQLQENGLLSIVIYAVFLTVLARRFGMAKRASEATRTTILVARVGLITGVGLLYGHFFLLHVQYSQATVAYWNWALFGSAVGVVVRARCCRPSLTLSRSSILCLSGDRVEPSLRQNSLAKT